MTKLSALRLDWQGVGLFALAVCNEHACARHETSSKTRPFAAGVGLERGRISNPTSASKHFDFSSRPQSQGQPEPLSPAF
jgi:hypothetical protein